MKLVIELPQKTYDQLSDGLGHVRVDAAVESVEVRQQGTLLSRTVRCIYLDRLSSEVANEMGLPDGQPALRLWLTPEEGT